ncbi:MAG: hypothetical protein K0S21_75 [Rhizobiaceae bacterium]|jgi:hypothetical protein|nr:hypothetical protein [Rhizobiaceae bacterium]
MRTDSLYLQRMAGTGGPALRGRRLTDAASVLVNGRLAGRTGRLLTSRASLHRRLLRP